MKGSKDDNLKAFQEMNIDICMYVIDYNNIHVSSYMPVNFFQAVLNYLFGGE